MLSVKATHNIETRRLVFEDARTLSYAQLSNELRRVFPIRGPFCLSSVSFATKGDFKWIPDVHGESKFEEFIRPLLNGQLSDADLLRFTIIELTVSPPIRNRVHTAPNLPRTTSSAWRYVPTLPARRNSSNLSTQTTARQTVVPQSQSPVSTAGIEASLDQLEKDFQEGEKSFTQAFNTLKREVIRLLAEAKSTSANASASPSASRDAHGHLQCGASRTDDADISSLLRIPGAFDQPSNNAGSPSVNARSFNYRYNVWCDFCGRGIRGTRAKCNNCADYDLCEECIQNHDALKKHADGRGHSFAFLPVNQRNVVNTVAAPAFTTSAPSTSKTSSVNSETVIHYGIVCDGCQETIVGQRNKCMVCFDYDLCEKCYPQVKGIHAPTHSFYVIERSEFPSAFAVCPALERGSSTRTNQGRPLPQPQAAARVIHQATCDLCDSVILGTRHKCLDCPDYDVCSTCYPIVGEQHPHHVFVALTTPQNLAKKGPSRDRMHYANCDACKKPISNIRYKCMHPECPDYDLCEDCEALPISVHPATHPMLKMRHPLTVIPTVYRVGGQTLIPEDLPSAAPCCGITTSADPLVQPTNEVEGALATYDLKKVVNCTAAADSLDIARVEDTFSAEETPQLTLVKDVPDQHEFSKNADAFTLSPELAAPVSPTASITGRLSLKQMLSEPSQITSEILVEAFQEKVATAAEILLRPLPSDAPTFGLSLKQEYYAAFISNNNVADGQVFPAGAEFVKSWRMVNNGNVAWPDTTEVLFVAGDRLAADEHASSKFPVGRVEPGQEVDVSAGELKAPETSGKYVGYWKLSDGSGRTFGQSMWCEIVVAEPETNLSKSLSSSEMIMPGSAPSVVSTVASVAQAVQVEEPSYPTSPSISSSIPTSDIDSDDSSALLEEFETASDMADWEEIRNQANRGTIDPEYVVLYDEDHTDDE